MVMLRKIATRIILLTLISGAAQATESYRLLRKISIGGDGGWDYMTPDPSARRLYVSHSTQVEVLDMDSGKPVGKIDQLSGVHGIALAPEFGRGFITNGKTDSVTIFDLKSLQKLGDVKTGKGPDAIIYDPATHRVFAYNGDSENATVIAADSGKVVGTIPLGGGPEFSEPDGQGKVYVNLENKSELLKIDAQKMLVEQRWTLAPCEEPSSMAIDAPHRRVFVGCRNKLMVVVDGDGGKVVASIPIDERVDAAAFDLQSGLVFESNGVGTVTVIHEDTPDHFRVVQALKTQVGSRNMALDEKTHHLFLSAAEFDPPEVASPANPRPRPRVKSGTFAVLEFGQN